MSHLAHTREVMIMYRMAHADDRRSASEICLLLGVLATVCSLMSCTKTTDSNGIGHTGGPGVSKTKLTKAEIIQIARKSLQERFELNPDDYTVYYDKGNKIWNKHYAQNYPNLVGRAYQAVRFLRRGPLTPGGGPTWVCVDVETGEVLGGYLGI